MSYGCETWVLSKESERLLRVWERKVLRRIYGPVCENGNWRMRKNEELKEMFQEPDLVSLVKKNLLRWLGHLERMPASRIPKKMLEGEPGGERVRKRPRLRWLDVVLREMGIRGWRRPRHL